MDNFCNSTFWDTKTIWNTDDPDFTICFEKTVLIWIPCGFLWLTFPLELYYLHYNKLFNIPFNTYNVAKLISITVMAAITFIDILLNTSTVPVDIYSPVIKFLSLGLFVCLTYANIKLGIRSSGILFLFSFLLVICGLAQFRTEFRSNDLAPSTNQQNDNMKSKLYILYYQVAVFVFILNCFNDAPPCGSFHPINENTWPEDHSSFISKLSFSWFDALAWKGYKKPLEENDLWDLDFSRKASNIVPIFEKHWLKALQKARTDSEQSLNISSENNESNNSQYQQLNSLKTASILSPIFRTFRLSLFTAYIFSFCGDVVAFVSPQVLSLLLDFIESNEPIWKGYLYSSLLFIVATVQTIFVTQYSHRAFLSGFQIKSILISIIYKKALSISNSTRKYFTAGEIVNLISVDVERYIFLIIYSINVLSASLKIILSIFFLWRLLGLSVLAGFAVMVFLIPMNNFILLKIQNLRKRLMENKDKRIKIMNEMLSGIKILKLYAWEPSFEKQILSIRYEEMKILKQQAYLNAIFSFMWLCSPFLTLALTFSVYVLSDANNTFNVKIAFVSLSLFNLLRNPLSLLPRMITYMVQMTVSTKRINKFLSSEELDLNIVSHEDTEESLIINDGTFSWEADEAPVLRNLNIKIDSGKLVAVVGAVGCGKSSLISAFLGETYKISGYVNTKGTIAYVPQEAWIQNATVRDNIIFGYHINIPIYNEILEACALNADLNILPSGDLTEIGEKGINLSGGQKQRISLARAAYYGADVYFFDDPLSAVDSHVGKHIFDKLIGPNGILRNKTRILVTHNVTFLPYVDFIIVLKNGTVSESGTYKNLLDNKGDFAKFLQTYSKESESNIDNDLTVIENSTKPEDISEQFSSKSGESSVTSRLDTFNDTQNAVIGNKSTEGQQLIETEQIGVGNVKFKVYKYYLQSISLFFTIASILLNITYQGFAVGSDIWLSKWSTDASKALNKNFNTVFYLIIYISLGLCYNITEFFADLTIRIGCWKGAKFLHDKLLHNIIRLPLVFMDTTPIGRILSRFSTDIDLTDSDIPNAISDFIGTIGDVFSTFLVITYSTPNFIIVIVPITAIYLFILKFYVASSRQIKRLESASRSPVYSHFGETILGAPSIRAYNNQERFYMQLEDKVDFNVKCGYLFYTSNRWLSLRLGILGACIIFFSAVFSVISKNTINVGLVGLSVSYAMQITLTLSVLIRMISTVDTNIVAVERIKEYSEIKQEAPWEIPNENVGVDWPETGEIMFQDFKMRYRKGLDLILKEITFHIKAGEKVGVVGRTGAGKSSLTLSLFRIIESAGGKILIDKVDISQLGLHTLRSRLTIIPQDPVLFTGTLRFNLDPSMEYSDESIWHALELAHLKKFVSNLTNGLQHYVTEGGDNFSVGQKQLICLARALLRKSRILVLDEATAAVDLETDNLLQTTIRKEFKHCTILTIAHRLNTIMDYDRVIVLEQGCIIEYDTPLNLLKLESSVFHGMAVSAGLL